MKTILAIAVLSGIALQVSAQSFYVKFGGGYSFPMASYPLGKNDADVFLRETNPTTGYYEPSIQQWEEEVTGSFNHGVAVSLAAGYTFSSNIGLEVTAGYVFGKTYENVSESLEKVDEAITHSGQTAQSWRATNGFIAPSLVITTAGKTLKPYVTAGPVLALTKVEETFRHQSDFDMNLDPSLRQEEYSGGLSIGVRGAVGLDIKLGESVALFSEIAFTGMGYYPKEKETVKYAVDGEDVLETLDTRARRTQFVKNIRFDSRSDVSSPDEPDKALRIHFGMSSLTAMAGLKFLL